MAKYILVYDINDYCENGGGIQVEYPIDEQSMHKRVEELHVEYKGEIEIKDAGFLATEFEYDKVEYATKFNPKHKR